MYGEWEKHESRIGRIYRCIEAKKIRWQKMNEGKILYKEINVVVRKYKDYLPVDNSAIFYFIFIIFSIYGIY